TLELESWRIIDEGDYQKYLTLTPAEKNRKILQIEELLAEDYQTPSYKAKLLFELGNLLVVQK
ncbi:MAG TPA: prenyltransferase, partial [Cyanobacteria bacterium UBA11148]|nr:prenyltransferase [Cyanobacteria bacterium UBA11148]